MTRPRAWVRRGLAAGAVAASATAGAVVGFAARAGRSFLAPFESAGDAILRAGAVSGAASGAASGAVAGVVGVLAHLGLVTASAMVLALVVGRMAPRLSSRLAVLLAAGALVAAGTGALSVVLLPKVLRLGNDAAVAPVQIGLLYALLAGGLATGMRIAQQGDASAPR